MAFCHCITIFVTVALLWPYVNFFVVPWTFIGDNDKIAECADTPFHIITCVAAQVIKSVPQTINVLEVHNALPLGAEPRLHKPLAVLLRLGNLSHILSLVVLKHCVAVVVPCSFSCGSRLRRVLFQLLESILSTGRILCLQCRILRVQCRILRAVNVRIRVFKCQDVTVVLWIIRGGIPSVGTANRVYPDTNLVKVVG